MEQQLRKDPVTGIYSYVDVEEPKEAPIKEAPVKEAPKVTKPMKKK